MLTKFAAALLLAGGFVGSALFILSGRNVALAALQGALEKVESATYTITNTMGDDAPQVTRVKLLGADMARADLPDGNIVIVNIKEKKMLQLFPQESKAIATDGVPFKDFSVIERLSNLKRFAVKDQPAARQHEVDGKKVIDLAIEADGLKYNVWIDTETNLPLRLESENRRETPDSAGVLREQIVREVWADFVFNPKLDKSLFDLVPPAGFAVEHRTAPQNPKEAAEAEDRRAKDAAQEAARAKQKR